MATTALEGFINEIVEAIEGILLAVASAISANATAIGEILVVGGLGYMLMRYGGRILTGVSSWFSGLLR